MQRHLFRVGVVLAASAVLSACATNAGAPPAEVATFPFSRGDVGMAANVSGFLDFSSGCVRFADGSVPVFAAPAVAWDGEKLVVEGRTYGDGDYFGSADGAYSGLSPMPSACDGGDRRAVSPSREFMRAFADATVEPCHGEFVADVDTNAQGSASPEAAATSWAEDPASPDGAPFEGWESSSPDTVASHSWRLGVTQTTAGGWIVSGLDCAEPFEPTG